MAIKTKTKFGAITISNDAIASVAADAVLQCYGIVGIGRKNSLNNTIVEILKKGSFTQGVIASQDKNLITIDLYVVVAFDVKITEVLCEVQKRVKYVLEKTFETKVKSVNVFAQNLKRID